MSLIVRAKVGATRVAPGFERLAALEKTANPEPGWSDAVGLVWRHGGFTGDKHESLILAQNERWRHA